MSNSLDPLTVARQAQKTANDALVEARAASGMLALIALLMFIILAAVGLAAILPR